MCISIAPVSFAKTVTGLFEAPDGNHVVYYQNRVGKPERFRGILSAAAPSGDFDPLSANVGAIKTRRGGGKAKSQVHPVPPHWQKGLALGNALVIPILTDDFDSIDLLRDTQSTPRLLSDIRDSLSPPRPKGPISRGGISFGVGSGDRVEIEQFDIYTLVKASRAGLIPEAVEAVPARQRPPLNPELFKFLESAYGCPFVVACFNNDDAGDSKPIAYKYSPRYPGWFMIYTLDSHDGSAPDLDAQVTLDHAVFVGSHRMNNHAHAKLVRYSDSIPPALANYVPTRVLGESLEQTRMINGDILVSVDDVVAGKWSPWRVSPPLIERASVTLADAMRG